jgi:hypothetical protein
MTDGILKCCHLLSYSKKYLSLRLIKIKQQDIEKTKLESEIVEFGYGTSPVHIIYQQDGMLHFENIKDQTFHYLEACEFHESGFTYINVLAADDLTHLYNKNQRWKGVERALLKVNINRTI